MSQYDDDFQQQMDSILKCLVDKKGIYWSLNDMLSWTNRAVIGEYHYNFDNFYIFNQLNTSSEHFGKQIWQFSRSTKNFLESLQAKFLPNQKKIVFNSAYTIPDLKKQNRDQIYYQITRSYLDLKNALHFGHGILKIIKETNGKPPTRNEVVLFLQKIWRFLGDTLYKGQIMVRSLITPYLVHCILFLIVELALWDPLGAIDKKLDEILGKGKLIPYTTLIWDGKKNREAIPLFLETLRNPSNNVLESIYNLLDPNPFNGLYTHRVPVDPSWLPDYTCRQELGGPLPYIGSLCIGTMTDSEGNKELTYYPGVKNIAEALRMRAPDREYDAEKDFQQRLEIYQQGLYGHWLMEIQALGSRFYRLISKAMPILKQPCRKGDLLEQVGYLESINDIYADLKRNHDQQIQDNSAKIPKGYARMLPDSPFVPSRDAQTFIRDYVKGLDKNQKSFDFNKPLLQEQESTQMVSSSYRDLKKNFYDFYHSLARQVKSDRVVKPSTNVMVLRPEPHEEKLMPPDPVLINVNNLEQLFWHARQYAQNQKIKDVYQKYGLKNHLTSPEEA